MATRIQDYIDFCLSSGRNAVTAEHCFSVGCAFPSMGDLDKTVVLFSTESSTVEKVLSLIRLFPQVRAPQIRNNYIKVSFTNPQAAIEARTLAEKHGIGFSEPKSKKSLEEVDFSSVREKKIYRAKSKNSIYYGRVGNKVLILFRQNGENFGEYDRVFSILTTSLKGEILEEETLCGKPTANGEKYFVTEYVIARRLLEKRLGIQKKDTSIEFEVVDGEIVKINSEKKLSNFPSSLADCFAVG